MEATVLKDKFAVRIDGIDLSTLDGDDLTEAKKLGWKIRLPYLLGKI